MVATSGGTSSSAGTFRFLSAGSNAVVGENVWDATLRASIKSDPVEQCETVLRRRAVLLRNSSDSASVQVSLVTTCNGVHSNGLVYDAGEGTWNAVSMLSGGLGIAELTLRQFNYIDKDMDVDGNGRFNQLDVDGLIALIGSNDPDVLNAWDFDDDNDIDAEDVATLQLLVDSGLDSGFVGDLDRDGVIDCDSIRANPEAYFGYTIGDPLYRVECDLNLDGITDLSDRLAFFTTVCSKGNLNCDGSVDGQDAALFALVLTDPTSYQAAFPACDVNNADIDLNSMVNTDDISPFVSLLLGE